MSHNQFPVEKKNTIEFLLQFLFTKKKKQKRKHIYRCCVRFCDSYNSRVDSFPRDICHLYHTLKSITDNGQRRARGKSQKNRSSTNFYSRIRVDVGSVLKKLARGYVKTSNRFPRIGTIITIRRAESFHPQLEG